MTASGIVGSLVEGSPLLSSEWARSRRVPVQAGVYASTRSQDLDLFSWDTTLSIELAPFKKAEAGDITFRIITGVLPG